MELNKLIKESLLLESAKEDVKKLINGMKDVSLDSITNSDIIDIGLVVRFEDKEAMESGIKKVKSQLRTKGYKLSDQLIKKYDASNEITDAQKGSESVRLIWKYQSGQREGIVLEHILAYVLSGNIDDKLKNRLGLDSEVGPEVVKQELEKNHSLMLKVCGKIKEYIVSKFGNIVKTETTGSTNHKADLVCFMENGTKLGISLKYLAVEDKVKHTMNKVLGFGSEKDSLVYNPNGGIPWWLVLRRDLAKKLGRQFTGSVEDTLAPEWMNKAKENKKETYDEAVSEVYEQIREVFVSNLKNLSIEELNNFIDEGTLGSREEQEQYDSRLKIVVKQDKITIQNQSQEKQKTPSEKLSLDRNKKNQYITPEGSRIYLDREGLGRTETIEGDDSVLMIDGLKFKSNPLSEFLGDLKIKTR